MTTIPTRVLTRILGAAALSGALVAAAAGTASAATTATHQPPARTAPHSGQVTPDPVPSVDVRLTNASDTPLNFLFAEGGAQSVPSGILWPNDGAWTGSSTQDFALTRPATGTNEVTAHYTVMSQYDLEAIGSADVVMDVGPDGVRTRGTMTIGGKGQDAGTHELTITGADTTRPTIVS